MAKIQSDEFERYETLLSHLCEPRELQAVMSMALYDGADKATECIMKELYKHPTHRNAAEGMTKFERRALIDGFGISAHERKDGNIDVKLGFAGYNTRMKTRKHPKGVPIPLTARSLLKGTSWRVKDDFMTPAVNKARKSVDKAIEERFERELKNRMGEN